MIERWEIRENTITSNPEAIYLLLMIGTDEYAGYVAKGLASFARLVSVRVPPFSHVFELYNIVDDSVLEKIRIKMEELSQYVGIEGDINERTKHVDLDVISPETEIFGDAGNNMQQEPAVFMEEPDMPSEDNDGRRQTFSIKPETDSRQQLREDPFVANQKNERKVMSSEIFSDTQPSTGKVHLSGGDFSVHKDSSSLETFDVEDGTSIDVGDGTFINLNGAEGTQLKRFEDTDLNVQSEDSMPSGVGIATLIGGKYHDEEPDQSSNSLPSLRLMGGLANDANQAQRELIKDPYKPAPAPEPVRPVRNVPNRISNQNQYMPSVDNSVKQKGNIAKEEIPNQTINNNKASAQKRVPDNKSGHKSGGFLGGFFSKIMNKFSSEKKKEEPAPLAFTNSRPETKDFNQLLQEEQTKQTEQASLQAKTEENNVPVATEQKTPEQPNPFANLGAPKKDEFATDVPKKPAVNNFHSISAGEASSPLELDNNVPEELSAKIEVDDIFAAETLCEFYADEEDTSTNNVDRILGVSSPAQSQQNKKADLSKQPLGGEDNLLDVPENIFSTPYKEKANPKNDSLDSAQNQATKPAMPNKETEKEPVMKVSSGQRVSNPVNLKPSVMQTPEQAEIKRPVSSPKPVSVPKPVPVCKPVPQKTATTPVPAAPVKSAFGRVNIKEILAQSKAAEYGKDKLKDAIADKIDNADPIGMLKAGFMPKKSAAAPKQETEPKQASEPKKTISESKPAVIGLKQTVVAKPVVPSKPVIPVKNIPISKPAIAGVSKTVALNKPKINTNASFKPVQNNLNNSGNINRADAKKDFNKNTEQINKGEKRVIMTQDSSNNFNKPVRPNIPVAPKKPLGPKPAVPAAPKIPSTPRPPIPGVRPSVPVKRPVSQPNIAKPAPQVRPQNPARPQVSAGGHTPSVRPQVPLNPAQNVAAAKPAPKPAPEPRAATSIDHTILISAGQIYKRNNWPLEIPLNPLFTFDNMDMASNRFAHATAMSVIDNIGNMHNPFMLYGESGTGKSHFLNAMGYEISKKIGQEKIFLTNGVRLSRGVQRYVEENKVAQLEEFFSSVEVLIIDDIHLTAVNEHNRDFISRLLNRFLQEHKQMIISSKYPPESLARFEELVRFRLDQGWVSELKPPRQMHFSKIYKRMFEEADLGLNEEQQQQYLGNGNVNKTDLSLIARDIKRVQVLSRRINNSGLIQMTYDQILNEMLALDGENPDSEILRKNFADITSINKTENTEWGNFGFFYPQDQADKFKWMAYCVMQKAREMGIKGGFNFALKSGYSTDHIISAAFKIANICDTRNLKGAIILGPDLTVCQKSIRDNFYDILMHMLEVMMIRCGIIDAENIKMPSAYVRVLGDVLK